jgi:hypothetical protein
MGISDFEYGFSHEFGCCRLALVELGERVVLELASSFHSACHTLQVFKMDIIHEHVLPPAHIIFPKYMYI